MARKNYKIVKEILPRTGLPFWWKITKLKDGFSIEPAMNPKIKLYAEPQGK